MALALAVPPLPRGDGARAAARRWRSTARGTRVRCRRAWSGRRRHARLLRAAVRTGRSASPAFVAALPAHHRRLLRDWRAAGWLAAAAAAPPATRRGHPQCGAGGGGRGHRGGGRCLRHVPPLRHHRQRQDGRLPRGGRDACSPRGGQVLMLVPGDQPDAAARRARARRAAGTARWRRCTAALPDGERRDALARGGERRGAARARHAARGVRAAAGPGAHRRRRGARRLVQAAGQRALPRARRRRSGARAAAACRWCWAAPRRRSSRGWPRARAATAASTCRRAPIRARRLPRGAARAATAPRASRTASARRCARRSRPASRAASSRSCSSTGAASRPRWSAPRASGRRSARAAARGSPRIARRRRCAAIIAATWSALPHACPACGNVDLVPLGLGTQRLERALAAGIPVGAHRAGRPRQHARAATPSRACASRWRPTSIDILVGTQMLAKGHDFPAAHAGRHPRRRQRALQRRFSRDRAPGRTADAGGRPRGPRGAARAKSSCRPTFPSTRSSVALVDARLRAARRRAARRSGEAGAVAALRARRRCWLRKPIARGDVDAFLARGARERRQAQPASRHGEVDRLLAGARAPARADAPASSAASSSCRACGGRRCSASSRLGGRRSRDCRGRRVRWSIDVDPAGFG